jgi:hypothetical protein
MGAEAACTLHYDGQATEGKALLESEEILFRPSRRGGPRLSVAHKAIRKASARAGVLRLEWDAGTAELHLGDVAEKWLAKLQNPRGRLDKLGVKAGERVVLVGAFDDGFAAELEARGARLGGPGARALFYAVDKPAALGKLAELKKRIDKDGAIWVVRRKGAEAPVREAEVRDAAKAAGLVDVKVVAFSETHTAEKLVIPVSAR